MKRIICLLLSVFLILTLAACRKEPEGTASAQTQPPTQTQLPTELPAPSETQPAAETQAPTETTEPQKDETVIRPLTLKKSLQTYFEWADELPYALVRSEHSTVSLGGEDAGAYPEMAQVLCQLTVMQENAMLDEFDNLVSFAREDLNRTGASFETYVSTLDVQVRRADSLVISLLSDSYSHYGQIQYYRVYHGSNYDPMTGREILLNEVVDVNNYLALAVEKELLEQMYAEAFHSEYVVQNYFADTPYDDFSWTLDYTGVTFYFTPGQFCEGGAMAATVTFAEYPELFNEKYTKVPAQYSVEMPLDIAFFADLNGDGEQEAISVSGCYDNERNCYLDFGVYTNQDGCWYEECYAHELHPYYVKAADGQYLYLFFEDFDEGVRDMRLMVLRLNTDGSVAKSGEIYAAPSWLADNQFLVPTDPCRMFLDNTDSGAVHELYSVGSGGMPVQ